MTEFDEVSRAIGSIEGEIKGIKEAQLESKQDRARLEDKVDKINEHLTSHRIKTAGVAGGVTVGLNLLLHKLKEIF